MGANNSKVLAMIAFEADAVFLTPERPSVSFGRAAECIVRFGHQPTADVSVPRVAGTIRMVDERVGVDNLSDKVAFDVKTPDGPLETVRPGTLLAPPSDRFEISYQGSQDDPYLILVHRQTEPRWIGGRRRPPARAGQAGAGSTGPSPGMVASGSSGLFDPSGPSAGTVEEPETRVEPDLTDRQWEMLGAYTDPLRQGRTAPATHKEVAAKLHWSYATMRVECNAIWAAFKIAGVPMREFRDKRDAVIDAAVRHHLVPPGSSPLPDSP
jgi:hypothetical protein